MTTVSLSWPDFWMLATIQFTLLYIAAMLTTTKDTK